MADKTMHLQLLDHWETLPLAYRIPKRMKQVLPFRTLTKGYILNILDKQDGEEEDVPALTGPLHDDEELETRPEKRSRYEEVKLEIRPVGYSIPTRQIKVPTTQQPSVRRGPSREEVAAVIASAAAAEVAAAEAAAAATAAAQADANAVPEESVSRKKHRSPKKMQTDEEKEANKEKRLLKLVGAVVVKCMSKHSKAMDHDIFKKHAKEVSHMDGLPLKRPNTDVFNRSMIVDSSDC
jgi:histone-lysine N-methyltransferase SETD2